MKTKDTNRDHAIRYLNGEISQGKLIELVPNTFDLVGVMANLVDETLKVSGLTKITVCHNCGELVLRRRIRPGYNVYCDREKCQKVKKLGHDTPVSMDTIGGDNNPSPYREIRQYNGGYSE